MPIMNWDASLSIGIQEMDDDHADILNWMNEVFDRHQAGSSSQEIIFAVEQLQDVTIRHFREEEQFLERIEYPELALHKEIHKTLLEKLDRGVAIIKKNNGAIHQKFFNFLQYWLTAHIKGIDMKYASFSRIHKNSAA